MSQARARRLDQLLSSPDLPTTGARRELDPRLHPYQVRAVRHLWDHPRAALWLDMGMGKTSSVLQALTAQHLPALVVAPKRVALHVWPAERDKWRPDLDVQVAAGTPTQRARVLSSGADVVTIGRENLADVAPGQFRTIVLDESSGYKNLSTQRFKTARRLCASAPYVWQLTGTPSPNGYLDLWAQVFLLDQGYRLGKTMTSYRERYFTAGRRIRSGQVVEWNLAPGSADAITQRLSDIVVSMQSADYLQLPAVRTNLVQVHLPGKVRQVYDELRTDLATQWESGQVTAANQAVVTGKLSQITAGFLYPDRDDLDGSTSSLHRLKTEAVTEVVEGTGSPVLVFYRFRQELADLQRALPGAKTIDQPGVARAWDRGQVPVLLAHPASVGHGLNLQKGGHTIVWSTPTWSSEEYSQANARLVRQGQDKPVTIHHVVAAGTVDEQILDVVSGKVTAQEALKEALGLDRA